MIKVSVLYPNGPDISFNHDYYRDSHMPMVKQLTGEPCRGFAIEKGLAGGAPGESAAYIAMGHLFFDSVEAFQGAFGPHAKQILGDIPNYTNAKPVIQISEVVVR